MIPKFVRSPCAGHGNVYTQAKKNKYTNVTSVPTLHLGPSGLSGPKAPPTV